MLYRRSNPPACTDPNLRLAVEEGTLEAAVLAEMRGAYAKARSAGLRRAKCDMLISNGGREALVITAPNFSDTTPEEQGCWSGEAMALHDAFLRVFGEQRPRQ